MRFNYLKEITVKEFNSFFDHISGYILAILFVGILYFFFLKTFYINGAVSLRSMFDLLPWFFAIFVPAITMGSFANEHEKQTIEYLQTKPIKQIELVVGKILGSTLVIYLFILLTLPLPFLINRIAPIDSGEVISGYLGTLLLTLSLAAMGVAVSTFYKNQIAAFITTAVLIVVLIVINTDVAGINIPVSIRNVIAQFSIIDNYSPLIRGVVNISNLLYFTLFVLVSIGLAYSNLQKIRISNTGELYKKTFRITLLIAIIGITLVYLSNYVGDRMGRIDLTTGKRYTLSQVSKDILNEEGKIKISVIASKDLPPQYQSMLEEIKNTLTDYKTAGGGNIEIININPETNGEMLSTLNIQPVQFNVVGKDQFQIKQGYLALSIANEDGSKTEKIDYIPNINDLEYQLTSLISKIKSTSKPAIGFVSGHNEKSIFTDYSALQQISGGEYEFKNVYLDSPSEESEDESEESDLNLSQYNLLVVAGPDSNYSEEAIQKIDEYIMSGGNVIYLADTLNIDGTTGFVSAPESPLGQLLSGYGAYVNTDMVYDLQSNIPVPHSTNQMLRVRYPYFIIAPKDGNIEDALKYLPETAVFPWAASLSLDSNWQWLYSTTMQGGIQTGSYNLDPLTQFSEENLNRIPLMALRKTDNGGTLVVSGSSTMFDSQFVSVIQENAVLALSLMENLGKGRGLSEIKAKNIMANQFTSAEDATKQHINYGAPAISFILLSVIGVNRIVRKKKLAKIYA